MSDTILIAIDRSASMCSLDPHGAFTRTTVAQLLGHSPEATVIAFDRKVTLPLNEGYEAVDEALAYRGNGTDTTPVIRFAQANEFELIHFVTDDDTDHFTDPAIDLDYQGIVMVHAISQDLYASVPRPSLYRRILRRVRLT